MAYMEHNRVLEKMRRGEFTLGLQLRSRSELIAELAGYIGFDFLYIETEHFACNDETIEHLARAAQVSGITSWLRITNTEKENIGHMLDIGIQGIIAPHLDTPEQARDFVDAVKFPPIGHRGNSTVSRAAEFGSLNGKEYIKAANNNCSAIGMIESLQGVNNLEAILDSGIDIIRVGRGDLSLDSGFFEKQNDARFVDILRHITSIANKKNIPVGTSATDIESAVYYKSLGFTFLTIASDLDYLKRNLTKFLKTARESLS